MKANISIRLVAILITILLAVCAVSACGSGNGGQTPVPSGDPQATASEPNNNEPEMTTSPSDAAEVPDASTYPEPTGEAPETSSEPSSTDAPGETDSPSSTEASSATAAPAASAAPGEATAQPTAAPTMAPYIPGEPTPEPTNTPVPDPVTELTYVEEGKPVYCDMDFDGRAEKIEVVMSKREGTKQYTVRITLGSSGATLIDNFFADKYMLGLLNNFNSGDERVELMLSTCTGKRQDVIRSYRLNPDSTGLLGIRTDGWIDSVHGNTVTVAKYADLMGTWECTCPHVFGHDSFELKPMDEDWQVKYESGRWCTVSGEMLVGLYISGNENYVGFLERGDRIYPTATDLVSRIDFMTDTNSAGYLSVTFTGELAAGYDGKSMNEWFSDLTFIK